MTDDIQKKSCRFLSQVKRKMSRCQNFLEHMDNNDGGGRGGDGGGDDVRSIP